MRNYLPIILVLVLASCSPRLVPKSHTESHDTTTSVVTVKRDTVIQVPADSAVFSWGSNASQPDSAKADTIKQGNIEVIREVRHGQQVVQVKELSHPVIIHNAIRQTMATQVILDKEKEVDVQQPSWWQRLEEHIGMLVIIIGGLLSLGFLLWFCFRR